MHDWVNLTNHLGESFGNPTDNELKETLMNMFKARDNEHPNTWIECGTENGPLYSLDIYAGGFAIYTVFNNVDMEEELENKKLNSVDVEKGIDLWKALINGELDNIK